MVQHISTCIEVQLFSQYLKQLYIYHNFDLDGDIDSVQKEIDDELDNLTTNVLITVPKMKGVTVPSLYNEETVGDDYGIQVWIGLSFVLIISLLLICVCMIRYC